MKKKIKKNLRNALKKKDINFFIVAEREIKSNENHLYTPKEVEIIKQEILNWEALKNYSSDTDEELASALDEALESENYEKANIIKTEKDYREK